MLRGKINNVMGMKLNLICDDKPVCTIEDLQNDFSIEDAADDGT